MANVVTLDDVVIEQMQTNERLDDIDNRFSEFFTILRADRLDMLEALRELRAPPAPTGGGREDGAPAGESGFLGTLLAIGAAITGAVLGFATGLAEFFKNFFVGTIAKIKAIWNARVIAPLTKLFDEKIKPIFDSIRKKIDDFKNRFVTGFNQITTKIGNAFKAIGELKFVKVLGLLFKPVLFTIEMIVKALMPIAKLGIAIGRFLGGKILSIIESIGGFFGNATRGPFSFFFKLFRALGRFFVPITVLIDSIIVGLEEFGKLGENASIGDYIQAAITTATRVFVRFFTGLGDLIKDVVSWIAEKLGFDKFSEWLDSFSFVEIGDKIVAFMSDLVFNKLFNMEWWSSLFTDMGNAISDAFDTVWDAVTGFFGELKNSAIQLTKNFVKSILPAQDALIFEIPKTGIQALDSMLPFVGSKVNLNPFPDSLYQWANEPVPRKIQAQANASRPTMEQTQRNQALASSGMSNMGGTSTVVNNVNNYAPTTNTSQVSLADNTSMPSSTTNNGLRGAGAMLENMGFSFG
jgi:hypothetical protein